MTLPASAPRASYLGTGSTGPFVCPFRVFAAVDLLVTKRTVLGVETTLANLLDYAVSGVGDATGNVTLTLALAAGETLVIRRKPALGQPVSIRNNSSYYASAHEDEFDRLAMQDLGQQDQLDRSFGVSETYDPLALQLRVPPGAAGQVLGWSGAGLTNMNLATGATPLPGEGRTVTDMATYLANNSVVNIKDYGAAPTNTAAQNTTALNKALTARYFTIAATKYYDALVFVPNGDYDINDEGTIPGTDWFVGRIMGESMRGAHLRQTNAAKAHFNFPRGYLFEMEELFLEGGTKALTFNTQNVDQAFVNLRSLFLLNQTVTAIEAQNGSYSTEFNIQRVTFQGNCVALDSYCDYTNIVECWANPSNNGPCFVNHGGTMTVQRLVGSPTASGATACWVKNYGHAVLHNNRWGTEDVTGRTVLEQYATIAQSKVSIKDCHGGTTDYMYKFFELPEFLEIDGNSHPIGGAGTKGYWFAAAPTTLGNFIRGNWRIDDQSSLPFYVDGVGSTVLAAAAFAMKRDKEIPYSSSNPRLADLVCAFTFPTSYPNIEVATSVTTDDTTAYEYLGGPLCRKITATANNAIYQAARGNDGVTGIPVSPGIYTYLLDCYVQTTTPILVELTFNSGLKRVYVHSGLNVLSVVYSPPAVETVGWRIRLIDMPNGATVKFGRVRVLKGIHEVHDAHLVFRDLVAAVPVSDGNHQYYKGDRVEHSDPASLGFMGRVVTTPGAGAEVWKTFGAIS